jgi:hypothetical protein
MTQEKNYNELQDMIDALQDVAYKLEAFYNSEEDRTAVLWQMRQLDKIENLLIYLKNENNKNHNN